ADRGPANDAAAVPEMLAIHHLPEVLDARGIFAHPQRHNVLDRTDDAARVPLQRRLAPAVESGLIGQDLDEDPVAHARVTDEGFNGSNFHGLTLMSPPQCKRRRA